MIIENKYYMLKHFCVIQATSNNGNGNTQYWPRQLSRSKNCTNERTNRKLPYLERKCSVFVSPQNGITWRIFFRCTVHLVKKGSSNIKILQNVKESMALQELQCYRRTDTFFALSLTSFRFRFSLQNSLTGLTQTIINYSGKVKTHFM